MNILRTIRTYLKLFFSKLVFTFSFRYILKQYETILEKIIRNKIRKILIIKKWSKNKFRLNPPHYIKQKILSAYAKKFSIKVLIETGTYKGDMIYSMRKLFSNIYSIELDNNLFETSKNRLSKYHNISIFHGNSVEILPDILSNINNPCIFWLDAHYSGNNTAKAKFETPIMRELEIIFNHLNADHIILIDDARLFTGENDYPTLTQVKGFLSKKYPGWSFVVSDDIIRIFKKKLS